ncbi:MAG: transposase [Minisyncoccota bacterium]
MPVRKFIFSFDEFYHLYSRGVDKRLIFLDDKDRQRFTRLLFICNGSNPVVYKTIQGRALDEIKTGEKLVSIGAYCLMPNHFHLLVKETNEGGIVKFMSKLLTAYSSYFNKKYERTGALFSSEFKAVHIDSDEHLKHMFAYIHMNPLKIINPKWKTDRRGNSEENLNFLKEYTFSSYPSYLNNYLEESLILNKDAFPEYFSDTKEWESSIESWLDTESFAPIQGPALDGTGDN